MRKLAVALGVLSVSMTAPVLGNEFEAQLTELANGKIKEIAQNATIVNGVAAQNGETAGYDQGKIDALDQQWRAEVDASAKPLIDAVLANDISAYLTQVQEESEGLFTEIFAMDAKGLNVGQSDVTSDYWQGDEGKWQNTYSAGAGSVDISEVEEDESTQTFQSQVSVPVLDENGAPIGAITFGINVEML